MRFWLPALLLLFAVGGGLGLYVFEVRMHELRFEADFKRNQMLRDVRIQADVERWVLRNDSEMVQSIFAELGVIPEQNAAPERLDLNDRDLRLAKESGCKITINSDSHDSRNLGKMEFGIRQLKRGWLGPKDVLNTLEAGEMLAALRRRP